MRKLFAHFILSSTLISIASGTLAAPKAKPSGPLLRCEVTYADQTTLLETRLQNSPYEIQAIDIGGRFLFKAAMIGEHQKINHIALYAYFQASPKDLPIHQAIYRGPFKPQQKAQALGPKNYLYAGEVERELSYQCFLMLEKK